MEVDLHLKIKLPLILYLLLHTKIFGATDTEIPGTCARAPWRLVPADSGNEGVEPLGVSFGPLAEFFLVG
jgi:hypothetical protein